MNTYSEKKIFQGFTETDPQDDSDFELEPPR